MVKTPLHRKLGEDFYLVLIVLALLLIGSVGYTLIEGWSFLEGLYMTVITLSTVGYSEVRPLSEAGRVFTLVLIIVGVGVAGYVLSKLIKDFFDQQFNIARRRRKMVEELGHLKDHTVFCGFGRLAQVAVRELLSRKMPIVIIDTDPKRITEAEELGAFALLGDATQDEVLLQANIKEATRLVSLLPTDADNLYVILAARESNPSLLTITRAEFTKGERRLKRAGASKVISPYVIGGQKIADGLLRPYVVSFLELTSSGSGSDLVMEEIKIPEGSPLAGSNLESPIIQSHKDIIIAAIITPDGQTLFNPHSSTLLDSGSVLIGLGRAEDVKEFERQLMPAA